MNILSKMFARVRGDRGGKVSSENVFRCAWLRFPHKWHSKGYFERRVGHKAFLRE